LTIESKRPVKVSPRVAVSFPAKTSVVGRLLTAQLPDTFLNELLSSNTPQDAAIRNQLSELRTTGQIVDRGAIEAEVVCVGRILRGHAGDVIGAIEVLIPQYRAKLESILPAVDEAATNLSNALGAAKISAARAPLAATVEKDIVAQPQAAASTPGAGAAVVQRPAINK
jgi:DNA-binding IclR family transcriptional regulator